MRLSTTLGLVLGCMMLAGAGTAYGELIMNGDFEAGGVGFNTQYNTPFGGNSTNPGELTVTNSPSMWNASFATPAGSSGQFLVANGATDAFNRVWFTTLNVTAGTEYTVSFDATTLSGSTNPARLGFYAVLDPSDPIAATNVTTLDLNSSPFDTWTSTSGKFTASDTAAITVFISDLTTAIAGNDFGIDNVSVVPEPSSLALLGIGSLVGLGVYTRRRRSRS